MSNGIVLPPLNIGAVSGVGSGSSGNSGGFPSHNMGGGAWNAPNPGHIMQALAFQRYSVYAEGYWREILTKLLEEQKTAMRDGKVVFLTNGLVVDFRVLPIADNYMCVNPSVTAIQALHYAHSIRPLPNIDEVKNLSGGVLTPVAALSHFLNGNGGEVKTNINSLGLRLSTTHIPQLEGAIRAAPIGSSIVNVDKVTYKTGQDSWATGLWLGSITLKVEGTLHKSEQSIRFEGVARAYHDRYDANKSTHRDALSESATSVLAEVERFLKGTPYLVAIEGEFPILISR